VPASAGAPVISGTAAGRADRNNSASPAAAGAAEPAVAGAAELGAAGAIAELGAGDAIVLPATADAIAGPAATGAAADKFGATHASVETAAAVAVAAVVTAA
jgi:hypothetical protein